MINFDLVRHGLLLGAFFSLGMNKVYLYAIFLILIPVIAFNDWYQKNLSFKRNEYLLFLLFLILLISVYFSPYVNVLGAKKIFLKLVAGALLCLYVNSVKVLKFNNSIYLVMYIWGVVADMSVYLIFNTFIKLGSYGKIYVPFTEQVENSPRVANLMAFCSAFFLPLLLKLRKQLFLSLLIFIVIVSFTYFGIMLKARSYILLLLISFILAPFIFIRKRKQKTLWFSLMALIGAVISVLLLNTRNGLYLIKRFQNPSMARLKLLKDGVYQIMSNPFGGHSPSKDIIDIPWFHNLYLDISRTSGFLGLSLIIIITIITFKNIKLGKGSSEERKVYLWSVLLSFILMQQDVILEGNYTLFAIFMMASLLATSYSRNEV